MGVQGPSKLASLEAKQSKRGNGTATGAGAEGSSWHLGSKGQQVDCCCTGQEPHFSHLSGPVCLMVPPI